MTTIAFRGGIMACDSAFSANDIIFTRQTKLTHTKHDVIIGFAGVCADADLLHFLEKIRTPRGLPSLVETKAMLDDRADLAALVSFPRHGLWQITKEPEHPVQLFRLRGAYGAIGSGTMSAITSMLLKKDAEEAVKIACEVDINSRLPVHVAKHRIYKPLK
jgi:ATP-dependent protease HslVU (ClpYQ) peptidase subunit